MRVSIKILTAMLLLTVQNQISAGEPAPFGFRGDGNGKFPNANPPLDWGRTAKVIKELSSQSRKPKSDEAPDKDSAMPDGVLRKWLVLGPLPIPESKIAEEALKDAATLSPGENEKVGDKAWQAVTAETGGCLDFCSIFNVPPEVTGVVTFAYTNIHSPSGEPLQYNTMFSGQGTNYIWLNGKQIFFSGKDIDTGNGSVALPLQKGWNRLMVMVSRAKNLRKSWWFMGTLYPAKPSEAESHGIVWSTFTPSPGSSSPIIAGDRVFCTGESGAVFCASKADGKLLWSRSLTYYDFATDEERKAHPDEFKELDALAAQHKGFDQSDVVTPWKYHALEKDFRGSVEASIFRLMQKVDRKKYFPSACEAGFSPCNPVTDGQFVYASFGTGIVSCYDLDGNLKWKYLSVVKEIEHGYSTSPLLVDGKLIVYLDKFTVLDAKTGVVVIERPHFKPEHGAHGQFFGNGCVTTAGNEKVLYFPNDEFVRLSDGKTLTVDEKSRTILRSAGNLCLTPVVENGVVYTMIEHGSDGAGRPFKGHVVAFKLPPLNGDTVAPEIVSNVAIDLDKFPYWYNPGHDASPLLVDGLLYCVDTIGTLSVFDMVKNELLYQRRLDLDIYMPVVPYYLRGGVSSSPTLAGKYLYIWGNQGTCVVIEPGRTFKQVARLRVDSEMHKYPFPMRQEGTITSPIFEGDRMYLRSELTLYCIGPK